MKLVIVCLLFSAASLAFADTSLSLTGRYEYRTDSESLEMLVVSCAFIQTQNPLDFYLGPKLTNVFPGFVLQMKSNLKGFLVSH